MKRKEDIEELLAAVEGLRGELERAYEKARADQDVRSILRPTVKSAMEHLRSCLDYAVIDVHETVFGTEARRIYFPFGDTESDFAKSLKNNLPNLDTRNVQVYRLVRGVQPFESGSGWLPSFARRTNKLKHQALGNQVRSQSEKSTFKLGNYVHVANGSTVNFTNVSFGGHVVSDLKIDDALSIEDAKKAVPHAQVSREWEWVEFRFDDSPEDILKLIGETHDQLCAFIPMLYDALKG